MERGCSTLPHQPGHCSWSHDLSLFFLWRGPRDSGLWPRDHPGGELQWENVGVPWEALCFPLGCAPSQSAHPQCPLMGDSGQRPWRPDQVGGGEGVTFGELIPFQRWLWASPSLPSPPHWFFFFWGEQAQGLWPHRAWESGACLGHRWGLQAYSNGVWEEGTETRGGVRQCPRPQGVLETGGGFTSQYLHIWYRTGWFQGLGLASSACPPLQGWRELARGPHPHRHFVLSWWGGTWPLAPCGLGLHIHKPRNSLKNGFFKKQNKTKKKKKGKRKGRKNQNKKSRVVAVACSRPPPPSL